MQYAVFSAPSMEKLLEKAQQKEAAWCGLESMRNASVCELQVTCNMTHYCLFLFLCNSCLLSVKQHVRAHLDNSATTSPSEARGLSTDAFGS